MAAATLNTVGGERDGSRRRRGRGPAGGRTSPCAIAGASPGSRTPSWSAASPCPASSSPRPRLPGPGLPEALGFLYQSLPLLVLAYVVHFGAQALRAGQVAVGGLPRRMGDAARMLGARRVRRLATVELPLMRPGLVSGGGLVLLSTMKELPATLLLAPTDFDTLATRIWGAYQGGFLAETGVTSLVLVALAGVLTWLLILRPT